MPGSNRGKNSYLELVFSLISNQEAYWNKDRLAVSFMRSSEFYIIGGKASRNFPTCLFVKKHAH